MRSDGSSTARCRAWMSRHRLTLCDRDRDRLTADVDRGRRSRVCSAIVSLGLVGRAVFAPVGSRRGLQNYAGNVFGPVAARLVGRLISYGDILNSSAVTSRHLPRGWRYTLLKRWSFDADTIVQNIRLLRQTRSCEIIALRYCAVS